MSKRYELTGVQSDPIVGLLPGKAGDPGRTVAGNRLFVNGVLWILRPGCIADYLSRKELIILDELGYLPFVQSGGHVLSHRISRLYD